jgi:hypothetical protein
VIPPDVRARIRCLFFAEHWRVGTIATELRLHHDTVRRAIEAERFIRPGTQVRPSMLDAYKAFIEETLDQHPRLRARSSPYLCVNRTHGEAPRMLHAALASATSFDFSRDMSR